MLVAVTWCSTVWQDTANRPHVFPNRRQQINRRDPTAPVAFVKCACARVCMCVCVGTCSAMYIVVYGVRGMQLLVSLCCRVVCGKVFFTSVVCPECIAKEYS